MAQYKLTEADVADLIISKTRLLGIVAERRTLIVPEVKNIVDELSALIEYATVVFLPDNPDECHNLAPNQENGTE